MVLFSRKLFCPKPLSLLWLDTMPSIPFRSSGKERRGEGKEERERQFKAVGTEGEREDGGRDGETDETVGTKGKGEGGFPQ